MTRVLVLVAAALVVATPAHAASFGESPSRATPGGVLCLHATGEPGGLTYDDPMGFPGQTVHLRTDAGGLRADASIPAEPYGSCTALDLRPTGTGIAAYYYADEPGVSGVRVLLRDGGTWGPPLELPASSFFDATAVAISDAGQAVVAGAREDEDGVHVIALRRAPGGDFSAPETIAETEALSGFINVEAGVTDAGETVVAWSFRTRRHGPRQLWATFASPERSGDERSARGSGAFQTPVRLGTPSGPFALAVGAGGEALAAFAQDRRLLVAQRATGGGFGPALTVGVADDPLLVFPAAAMRADGAAVVGWADFFDGGVHAVTRPASGTPWAEAELARRIALGFDRGLIDGFAGPAGGEEDFEEQFQMIGAGFSGERALVAWAAPTRRDGVYAKAPSVATLPLVGGAPEIQPVGNGLRDVTIATPLVLADGRPAVAWAERERLHIAVEGAVDAAGPPAPRVRIGAPRTRVLAGEDPLVLPVTCSAACDVRASVRFGMVDGTDEVLLSRAGSGTLELRPNYRPIGRVDGAPIPVYVRSGAPGTRHPRSRTVMVRVRRKPGPPLPRVRDARARRDGGDVVVTWRTDRDAHADDFYVYVRGISGSGEGAKGTGRRFQARLEDIGSAGSVTIVTGAGTPGFVRRTTLEIT